MPEEEAPKTVFTFYEPPKTEEPVVRAVPKPEPPALRSYPGSKKMPDGSIELHPK
jgi:hypothetical protein